MMYRSYTVLRYPHVSEKASILTEQGQYLFDIDPRATKGDVKKAVESIFSVNVLSVNIVNRKGKQKMTPKRKLVRKKLKKIAFVKIQSDQVIDFSSFSE